MNPTSTIGAPLFTATRAEVLAGLPLDETLPVLFDDLNRAEIFRRWKAGALKVNGKNRAFDTNDVLCILDIGVSKVNRQCGIWVSLGKQMMAVITVPEMTRTERR